MLVNCHPQVNTIALDSGAEKASILATHSQSGASIMKSCGGLREGDGLCSAMTDSCYFYLSVSFFIYPMPLNHLQKLFFFMIFSICDYFTGEQLCRAPPTATLSQTLQCPMQKSTFFYNPNLFLFTPPFSLPPQPYLIVSQNTRQCHTETLWSDTQTSKACCRNGLHSFLEKRENGTSVNVGNIIKFYRELKQI